MENAMKHIHRTRGDRVFDAINVAALCLLLAVILYPLIYVLSCSFSDPLLVVQSKITFLPMQPTLVAYQRVFRNELIMTGYQNTLFYTLLGTVLSVFVTILTGCAALAAGGEKECEERRGDRHGAVNFSVAGKKFSVIYLEYCCFIL